MGAISSNVAESVAKQLISVTNSTLSTCKMTSQQQQSAVITVGSGSNFSGTFNWNQQIGLRQDCVSNATTANQISQDMAQKVDQVAKAVAQQFQLSAAVSSNVTRLTSEMATAISNSFTNECSNFGTQQQALVISTSDNTRSSVFANWNQVYDSTLNCVQKSAAVNSAQQKLQTAISQEASATVENFLAGIIAAVAAVFAFIGIIFFVIIFMSRSSSSTVTVEAPPAAPVAPALPPRGLTSQQAVAFLEQNPQLVAAAI